ncbi:MAG: hypothetical protein A2987_01225 [Omnitrophica bacterium RIFCSPLOWO2_01_FULL_45_10]|nr:MAG: hypothetical protein A2987_01225 [Omnitrophica bacterium RIFCSPLOWO2_01_FULL_45_10]
MPKKKELTEKEINELYNWDVYYLDCVRLLKDDGDQGLDSYFRFSPSVYIKPNKTPDDVYMRNLVGFFKGIKKEKTMSYEEMPDFFKSFYFDEIHIEKAEEPDIGEDIGEHLHIFQENCKKGYPVLLDVDIELNSSGQRYRQNTRKKKYFIGYFGLRDLRFRNFIDALSLYNEFMPLQTISRRQFISFFNGLEDIKNRMFEFRNPEFKNTISTVSNDGKMTRGTDLIERYRFQIPFNNVSLRNNLSKNIDGLLEARNKLWGIIYPSESRKAMKYYFGRFSHHPIYDFFFQLLSEYDYELQTRQIADKCYYCGDMFKYKKGKKYCSIVSEKKDCGKKGRNFKDYLRHSDKRKARSKKYMSGYRKLLKQHGITNK